jgi:hypothetical protein
MVRPYQSRNLSSSMIRWAVLTAIEFNRFAVISPTSTHASRTRILRVGFTGATVCTTCVN